MGNKKSKILDDPVSLKSLLDTRNLSFEERKHLAALLYHRLFEKYPEYKKFFTGSVEKQADVLMKMMTLVVDSIDNRAMMKPQIVLLAVLHARRRIPSSAFYTLGEVFNDVLLLEFGDAYRGVSNSFMREFRWIARIMADNNMVRQNSASLTVHDRHVTHLFVNLGAFMRNSTCFEYLDIYLKQVGCGDTTVFLSRIVEYKLCPSKLFAQEIYDRHLNPSSRFALNISGAMNALVKDNIRGMNELVRGGDVFDIVIGECLRLIRSNKWDEFKESRVCSALLEDLASQRERKTVVHEIYGVRDDF